jgi:abortive infection bacteriophage resistance protein
MANIHSQKYYQKPTKDIKYLIHKLQHRGLHIPDYNAAENALTFIAYYRLS